MDSKYILAVIQNDLQLIRNLRHELEHGGFPDLSVTRNSEEAVLYLRGVGIYSNRDRYPLPSVIVLDCGNQDGSDLAVLSWLRDQPRFKALPVFMLCAEPPHTHPVSCALDASSFFIDKTSLEELTRALRTLEAAQVLSLIHRPLQPSLT